MPEPTTQPPRFNVGIGSGERDRLLNRIAELEAAPRIPTAKEIAAALCEARIDTATGSALVCSPDGHRSDAERLHAALLDAQKVRGPA